MSLEKLQQEIEELKSLDAAQMTPEQLLSFVDKLSSLINQSEESVIDTTLLEVNKIEEELSDNS
jgi:hypothetical protein